MRDHFSRSSLRSYLFPKAYTLPASYASKDPKQYRYRLMNATKTGVMKGARHPAP